MRRPAGDHKPAHVWAWLWGVWAGIAALCPVWVPIVGALALFGLYALVCTALPTYDCPRCLGKDRSSGRLVRLLASFFGGYRAGCRSRRCHDGQRIRLGVRVFQPVRAERLADNPNRPERLLT